MLLTSTQPSPYMPCLFPFLHPKTEKGSGWMCLLVLVKMMNWAKYFFLDSSLFSAPWYCCPQLLTKSEKSSWCNLRTVKIYLFGYEQWRNLSGLSFLFCKRCILVDATKEMMIVIIKISSNWNIPFQVELPNPQGIQLFCVIILTLASDSHLNRVQVQPLSTYVITSYC